MAELDERLKAAQLRTDNARSRKAKAEVQRDNAKEQIAQAKAVLAEFGAKTSADIERVRTELQTQIDEKIAEVEQALAEAGA